MKKITFKHTNKLVIILFLVSMFAVISSVDAASAASSTIYVNGSSGNNDWDGQSTIWNGTSGPKLTIKNATEAVDLGGTINIANGTYNGADNRGITISKDMTIKGENQYGTIIDAGGASPIFTVSVGVNFILQNLTLTNGKGAIVNNGILTIYDSSFIQNSGATNGAGIANTGTLTVINSTFTSNTASTAGGAISTTGGSVNVTNSTFTSNKATNYGTGGGGGIYISAGSLTVTNSTFTDNTGYYYGGAISKNGAATVVVTGSTFTENYGTSGPSMGGAIYNYGSGTFTIIGNQFIGNYVPTSGMARGGAIYRDGSATLLTINFNRFTGNTGRNGPNIYSTAANANAEYNWWGSNNGPSGLVNGITASKWLVMSFTADQTVLYDLPGTSTLTVDLSHDQNGAVPTIDGPFLDGIPVVFTITASPATATLSTLNGVLVNGQVTTTLTASGWCLSTVTAKIDDTTLIKQISTEKIPTNITTSSLIGVNGNTVDLSAKIVDKDGNPLQGKTIDFIINGASVGTAVTGANGIATIQYTITIPHGNYTLAVNFTADNVYASSIAIATFTVNNAPTFTVGNKTVNENQTLDFNLNANDLDSDTLMYSATGLPDGAVLDPATGQFTWTPTFDQSGIYEVTFYVSDGSQIANETVNITVNHVSRSPFFGNIGDVSIDENRPLIIDLDGADLDVEDTLSYSATGLPTGATLNSTTGVFSWTPTFDQSGTYTVILSVTDGILTVNKTIIITVNNVNRAPAPSVVTFTVNENQPLQFTVNGTDPDLDGNSLTYSVTDLPSGASFDSTTRTFKWTPSFNQSGTYTVTFKVSDGNIVSTIIANITVNDVDNVAPKVSAVDPVKNALINAPRKVINVTFNEAVNEGSLWIDLKKNGGALVQVTKSISGNVLTITPKSALGSGKYTLALHTGAVTDMLGNALAFYSTSFNVDSVAPKVSKIDPVNKAVKVSAGKTIKVTFNEAIKAGSKLWVELKNSGKKAVSFKYKISGKTLTIDPVKNLAESKYTLVLHTGAVTDLAGNALASKSTTFSVGTAPKVSKIDPKNGVTRVARSKIIKVTFNEAIKAGSVYKIELKTTKGKKVSIKKSISGKVLTIKHTKLAANTKYKLVLYTGSITDKAGNPVASRTYTFTTGRT